jgi:hypothetical protein
VDIIFAVTLGVKADALVRSFEADIIQRVVSPLIFSDGYFNADLLGSGVNFLKRGLELH